MRTPKMLKPAPPPETEICMQMTGESKIVQVEKTQREVKLCLPITIIVQHRRTTQAKYATLIGGCMVDPETQEIRYVVRDDRGFFKEFTGKEITQWNQGKKLMAETIVPEPVEAESPPTVTGGVTQILQGFKDRLFGVGKRREND
jgi:hypothetical protein